MNKNFYNRFSMHAVRALVLGLMLLTGFSAFGQIVQTFNSSTTWQCPAGVTSVQVECWGAGGGGGGASSPSASATSYRAGGGGGGGSYVINTITVVPGVTYTVTVGAGGTAGQSSNATAYGLPGGKSEFSGSGITTITASGGTGGSGGTSPQTNGFGGVLGGVYAYSVTTPGTGYANGSASVSGGGGAGAVPRISQTGGVISYIVPYTGGGMGSGYTSVPTLVLVTGSGGAATALVNLNINAGGTITLGTNGSDAVSGSKTSGDVWSSAGNGGAGGAGANGGAGGAVTVNSSGTPAITGLVGTAPGGGGSGGIASSTSSRTGGAGAAGRIVLTYTAPIANFYYNGTGSLVSTTSWGENTDGTGANPTNFTADLQVFHIRNTTSVSTDAAWTVSGTSSKIVLGAPSVAAVTLTIASGFAITGTLDIAAASSGSNNVLLQNTTLPTFGIVHSSSEVHCQTASIIISAEPSDGLGFGKLYIDNNSTASFSVGVPIATSLTVESGSTLTINSTNNPYAFIKTGGVVTINGTLRTSKVAGFLSFNNVSGNSSATTGTTLQFQSAESVGVNFILGVSSTIEHSRGTSGTAQTITPRSDYANLTISGADNNKTLTGAITVSGTLIVNSSGTSTPIALAGNITAGTLTLTAGKLTLGANTLTATTISGGSSTAYVVTDGAGTLTSPTTNATLKLFPIGASTSSYDPVEVTPTTGVNFSAKVSAAAPSSVSNSSNMAQREWNISATGAGSTVMSLTNGGTVYTPTTASMGHYKTDNTWEEFTGTTYSANKWTATNTSGSFSPFGGGELGAFNSSVLPVELANFQVKRNQTSALLTWTTASEKDNALFNIEQSTNGIDFQTVGQVKGRGTTAAATSYNFEHTTPSVGVNYYRLKQVDFNGATSFSAVRSVVFGKTGLVVKSTLVQDAVNILTSDDTMTPLSIFNVAGQQVLSMKVQGEQSIPVGHLPAGLYIIRTATGEASRFVKQ